MTTEQLLALLEAERQAVRDLATTNVELAAANAQVAAANIELQLLRVQLEARIAKQRKAMHQLHAALVRAKTGRNAEPAQAKRRMDDQPALVLGDVRIPASRKALGLPPRRKGGA